MNYIIGRKPVLEALKYGVELEQIYIAFGQKGDILHTIKKLALENNVKISEMNMQKIISISKSENTQGIIAIRKLYKEISLDELINKTHNIKNPIFLILDTIQDPQNLGAILRTAECAGVNGVIISTHNSAPITQTVEKISVGALSHLDICPISNITNAIKMLKENGFWIVGTSLATDKLYSEIDYNIPLGVVIGNEEKGIRDLVAKNCDFLVKIPMKGKIQSLNVSVATGVLLFEILRKRNC
ncbi:MAG: 23S rRNA (guanosine(2251)-2'-O)-methyltransferase RlmB, partial [Ignavibacteriales bacterium]|nr:23S rRNA (guanosine(2251)-2'-O)-methyltransferase RlmB [Ignavibacteriales bacterium]